ncbi:vitamin K epoxide reductase family protein [Streptomyces kanamyceticus]|uniref:Vitamin K epoxide reductase family protein n=1 Tax=Streptomyces kanamyceticus TaxID=1967 RepID=A0A5J6G4I1_STRKN|nr:vitamin K epoxide reductase family protein [Streptomyces kanamyceticus]QEU89672.1 vitamin K epoxide reductase family protein [Streptomyces kanamyceticus]
MPQSTYVRAGRGLSLLMLLAGALGTVASTELARDRIASLADPAFSPGCNINTVLSCGDVMAAWQSDVLGVPNTLLGIAGFAALAAFGLALLSGARFPRWLWLLLQTGVTAAFGFVVWLITQCLYVIGALCPWCMLVWAVVLPLFWYVTVHCLRSGVLPAPRRLTGTLTRHAWLGPVLMYGVLAALILTRFGTRLW